jgi:hypothetical protein
LKNNIKKKYVATHSVLQDSNDVISHHRRGSGQQKSTGLYVTCDGHGAEIHIQPTPAEIYLQ